MMSEVTSASHLFASLNVRFPSAAADWEQIVLRYIHFVAGFIWVGMGYFFSLCRTPYMKSIEGPNMTRAIAILQPRALWWMRWASLVTWLAGFRYFMILAQTDAANAGSPALAWKWIGMWLAAWVIAFGIIMALLRPSTGVLNNGWVLAALIGIIVAATSWVVLALLADPDVGNRTLCISVGGGMATVMFLTMWGVVWRCFKRIIAFAKANAEQGTPMPPETAKLMRQAFLATRLMFWLSFPMLFFMAASAHFAFLSGK